MATIEHGNRAHALLSASGADRWMQCTPSARLEDKFTESTSIYAEEGTLAHEFADLILQHKIGNISENVLKKELTKLRKHKLYTQEMEPQVAKYVDYVMEAYAEALAETPGASMAIEQRLDFSHLVERGFGTGDTLIAANTVLNIIDLKYGKGVMVEATDNPQLKLYGAGALQDYAMLYDIKIVRLTIVQPRLNHVSVWEISADDLIEWGEKVVKPLAKKAYAGKGTKKAGDHCKWCKVKAMCATLAKKNTDLARHEFADPDFLSLSQIVEIYKQTPMLLDWAMAVKSHLLKEALNGTEIEGFKVVEGKSNRVINDEKSVIDILTHELYDPKEFTDTKLKGLGALENLVGKKSFTKLLGQHITKPPGAPTLVPENDPRVAFSISSVQSDFG